MRDISKNIRAARERRGLTQDELGEQLHVSRQTVSNYETGRSRPDVEMLLEIARALGADVQLLLYGMPVPPEKVRERRRLWITAAVTLLVGLLLFLLCRWIREFSRSLHGLVKLEYLLRITAFPIFYVLLGWALLLLLGTALEVKPLQPRWARPLHWAVLGSILAYLILMAPYVVHLICSELEVYRLYQTGEEFSYSSTFQFLPIWDSLVGTLGLLACRYPVVFSVLGAALWGTRRPQGWPAVPQSTSFRG